MPHILPSPPAASPRASRVAPLASALVVAAAAWISQGSLADTGIGSGRVALLPFSLAPSAVVGIWVWFVVRRGASTAPLWLLALTALPWIPAPLPPALQLWTGPIVLLVWVAFALCLSASFPSPAFRTPSPRLVAGLLTFLLGTVAFWQVSPSVPGGDEPHYLVITQSLLDDGDIRIENNHRQRDYRAYFAGELAPDYRVRGRNGQIYSIHAPGVPALVAPAFAVAGYPGVVFFLLVLSSLGAALLWHLAWLVTERGDAAWFAWAAIVLSSTFLFHTFAVFPDGPGALVVLTGVWGLLRAEREVQSGARSVRPWLLHGAALALLPWMHTRFAVLAGGLGALILLRLGRTPNAPAKAAALLAVPLLSALGWIAYFIRLYGTPDPSAPYGAEPGSFAFVPDGLAGLFFDQRFGLFAYAPVLLFSFGGVAVLLTRPSWRRHAGELLFVAVPYLILVTYVAMWWGGTSAPARFFMPLLPWMAIPTAAAWTALRSRTGRTLALAALAFTAFASAALTIVGDGALAFNSREAYARWLEWLNGSVDLGRGLPVWWRDRELPLFRGIVIWSVVAAAGWFALRWLERLPLVRTRPRFATAAGLLCAAGASVALTLTWAVERVDGRAPAPAQLDALRRLSREPRLLALDLSTRRRIDRQAVAPMLRIEPGFSTVPGGAGRNDRPLFAVGAIPAGQYRLRFRMRSTSGWLMIGIGRDQFALRTQPLIELQDGVLLNFPVDVRAIMVRGDEDGRRSVAGLTIDPVRVVPPWERLAAEHARRAVHYPGAIVYFMDDRSFPEPEAFWVAGARETSVVVQPDQARPIAALQLRNGAAENTLLVQARGWRDALRLGPGEERQIDVPLDHARDATLVRFTTTAGFRPSDVDPSSRDDRFLGVWVKMVN